MRIFLYIIAIILIVFWAIGFFFYNTGGIIHILLALALFAILLRILMGPKTIY
ncbi:MAG: lmo0937 family membrane protein [Bacteroidetes bacterium]|nr:lmo0937 family membrane protein [Bacteroidota bacterium]